MAAPAPILEATIRFLKDHEPFARMSRRDLETFAERARLAYFPVGATILDPEVVDPAGGAVAFHVIQRGHVKSWDAAAQAAVTLGPGECFPTAGLAADALVAGRFEATEDVFCYLLTAEDFAALRATSAPFADFCARELATLLEQSVGQLHRQYSQRAVEQHSLLQPIGGLVRRAPVQCGAATPIRAALEAMHEGQVQTIAVVDKEDRPVGIFTLRDLLGRVVLAGIPLDRPIGEVMTRDPAALDGSATAQEAVALMAGRGFHQVMVTRGGRLAGVVTERDLFALQRVSTRNVLQSIRGARDIGGLRGVAGEIAQLTDNLIAQGAAAEPLTHTIVALNDALTHRLFEFLVPRFGLADLDWCWLSLGSEGRREQTIATDQDNALLFAAPGDPAPVRERLLPFARAVNAELAALGFPPCGGGIMAGNADWCLSEAEWRGRFGAWIREPTPEALLRANIFFDFRALAGQAALADRLRGWLAGLTVDNRLFLGLLVRNALQAEPPLGVIRSFRLDEGENAGTVDLKVQGTRIFVDAARAFALAFGIAETNTAQRLRLAGRHLNQDARTIDAWVDAFHFVQMLRLRAQRGDVEAERGDGEAGPPRAPNRIDPYALNALDKRMLKESFRQAKALQVLLEQTLAT